MLPWLIGAAVLGVGAAILSSSKDDSDNSSSSRSDYEDREKEAKERERQAAIENSQRLIDQKFSAIKSKWRINDAKQNKFLISKYHHSAATDSNSSSFVVPLTIYEQEEKFKTLQTELEQLNRMFAEVNGALNSARSSLQNGDYSEDIPTVDASTVDIQIVKDHPFKSSHTSSHTIKVNDKRAARNPFDVTGYTSTVKASDKRDERNPFDVTGNTSTVKARQAIRELQEISLIVSGTRGKPLNLTGSKVNPFDVTVPR